MVCYLLGGNNCKKIGDWQNIFRFYKMKEATDVVRCLFILNKATFVYERDEANNSQLDKALAKSLIHNLEDSMAYKKTQ